MMDFPTTKITKVDINSRIYIPNTYSDGTAKAILLDICVERVKDYLTVGIWAEHEKDCETIQIILPRQDNESRWILSPIWEDDVICVGEKEYRVCSATSGQRNNVTEWYLA